MTLLIFLKNRMIWVKNFGLYQMKHKYLPVSEKTSKQKMNILFEVG